MKNKTIKLRKDDSERGGDVYGKILVLTFEDSEEEILNHIISCVSAGSRAYQVVENVKKNLSFNGLEIDDINRLVRKQKQEIDLTFTEFEILYLLANNPSRVFSKQADMMNLTYEKNGDYQIPMVVMDEQPKEVLTKYGLMRKKFLQEHKNGVYTGLLLSGKLKEHLLMIQEQAEERMELLTGQMEEREGITEQMKAENQMLWVAKMNSIVHSAEEIVMTELIYS